MTIPNSAALHNIRHFVASNSELEGAQGPYRLRFHPKWCHMEPVALAMAAAWGARAIANGESVSVENVERGSYAARMGLFEHLGVDFPHDIATREESGRFLPIQCVNDASSISRVISDISALLHLQDDPETLAAARHCVSELLRNVLEHSGSPEGAFVCAHNFASQAVRRVSIAVADTGMGIRNSLARAHAIPGDSDEEAIGMALLPGVTGALPGIYGTPDNAGAGLFITRSIAKGSGGYFFVMSGNAAYRLKRARDPDAQMKLWQEPYSESHDRWTFNHSWRGTVAALEIRTDQIGDFDGYFQWIRKHLPQRGSARAEVRFT